MPPPYVAIGSVQHQVNAALQAHQHAVQILQTPGLAQALLALNDRYTRETAEADPMGAAAQAGINLPEGAAVYFHEFQEGWEVEIHIPQGRHQVILGFSSTRGFYNL